jgi:hypothetical protein
MHLPTSAASQARLVEWKARITLPHEHSARLFKFEIRQGESFPNQTSLLASANALNCADGPPM